MCEIVPYIFNKSETRLSNKFNQPINVAINKCGTNNFILFNNYITKQNVLTIIVRTLEVSTSYAPDITLKSRNPIENILSSLFLTSIYQTQTPPVDSRESQNQVGRSVFFRAWLDKLSSGTSLFCVFPKKPTNA